jgi:hypothetical protein
MKKTLAESIRETMNRLQVIEVIKKYKFDLPYSSKKEIDILTNPMIDSTFRQAVVRRRWK